MTNSPANPVVWCEIPLRDIDRGIAFYKSVFDFSLTRDDTGPNPIAMFKDDMSGVSGHLYPGEPSAAGKPEAPSSPILSRFRWAASNTLLTPMAIPSACLKRTPLDAQGRPSLSDRAIPARRSAHHGGKTVGKARGQRAHDISRYR